MASDHTLALIAANPFPGLRAFKPGESDRFFGRDQQIAELVARLAEVPLLAVSGASGCGKSSLVLAGLLAELRQRHADGDGTDWRPVVMRPGNRPIAHLAEPLARALFDDDEDDDAPPATDEERQARSGALFGQLRLGGLGLVEAVRQSRLAQRSPRARVLVVVDQFEEVFRFKRMSDPDEASAFVKLLLAAAQDPTSPVSVVITLRSDALGSCAEFRDLPEAVSRGGYLVPRLKRDQRKEAIVRPVEWRGARIAPRLVQRLLNDVSDDFDDLPVMQHALSRIWQQWAQACGGSRPIDLEDYEAVGTAANALRPQAHDGAPGPTADTGALQRKDASTGQAANALARHANEALSSLGDKAGTVERVFRALTERVGDGTEVRRPLPFAQLVAVAGDGSEAGAAAVREVVERYRRADTAFLLPGTEVSLDANPVIDISHESLIRQWDRLREWVQAEAVATDELKSLLKITRERAQGLAEPLHGADLERTRDWLARNRPTPAWVQLVAGGDGAAQHQAIQAFIAASVAAEKQAQRRSRAQRIALRMLVAGGVIAALAFGGYSTREQRLAQARELTNQALLELPRDPAASAHLALAALDGDGGNRRADYALRQAMTALAVAQPDAILALGAPLVDARFSTGQRWLVVAGGRHVWLIEPATMAVKHTLDLPDDVRRAWLVGQGAGERVAVLAGTQMLVMALPSAGGAAAAQRLECPGELKWVAQAAVSDGETPQIAAACADGGLVLATLSAGRLDPPKTLLTGLPPAATVSALAFSADGAWLAAGDRQGQTRVWKRGSGPRPWIGQGSAAEARLRHEGIVSDVAFHPDDPSLLATAGDDRSARVWRLDLNGGRLAPDVGDQKSMERLVHDRPVQRVRWVRRSDDAYKLMTVADKRVIFWTSVDDSDTRRHDDRINDADVSADGELLVSASADGTARVWSTRATTPMAVLRGHSNELTRAFFGPGSSVLSASGDGSLRRWRIAPPAVLDAERHWRRSVAFSPRGDQALVCGETGANRRQCRISALDDLGRRKQADQEWLASGGSDDPGDARDPDPDLVTAGSWRNDGKQVLGLAGAQTGIDQTGQWPAVWDVATGQRVKAPWLLQVSMARFNPARPELVVTERNGGRIAILPASALDGAAAAPPAPLVRFASAHAGRLPPLPSPDGRWVATDDGNDVLLWDRQAPQNPPLRLAGHAGTVRDLAFSADSLALVSASGDRSARVWPLQGAGPGRLPQAVVLSGGHSAAVISAVFSPDGRYVATGGADNSVRVWNAQRGWEISALYRHGDAVPALAWHADGRIASASDDGTVLLAPCQPCVAPLAALSEAAQAMPRSPQALTAAAAAPAGSAAVSPAGSAAVVPQAAAPLSGASR